MGGPYCETCKYFYQGPSGDGGECEDPAKIIYSKGGQSSEKPWVYKKCECCNMTKHKTPLLGQVENGPWPSFTRWSDGVEALAGLIGQGAPVRDFTGDDQPEIDEDAWRFYYFTVAQMAGTGCELSGLFKPSCFEIWTTFHFHWTVDREWLFGPISWADFRNILGRVHDFSRAQCRERYHIHMDLVRKRETVIPSGVPGPVALDSTLAYGRDPFRKKRNLLFNILYHRPECWWGSEGGPVVDYHIMRVVARVFGLTMDKRDPWTTEFMLRTFATAVIERMHNLYGLSFEQIDYALWWVGRANCHPDGPARLCSACLLGQVCPRGQQVEPRIWTMEY